MSTPVSPAPPHPTREQLDELEALMQRMLALPVNNIDDLGSNGHAAASGSRPAVSALAEYPPRFEDGIGGDGVEIETGASDGFAEAFPPVPEEAPASAPELFFDSGGFGPAEQDGRATGGIDRLPEQDSNPSLWSDVVAGPAVALDQAERDSAETTHPNVPVSLSPRETYSYAGPLELLVWVSRAFDWFARRFGPFGRWLSRPWGRALLGWTGLLLLAAAAAWWVLDWAGWTW
jgi:hypothetical protein